jgi:hypothetical protein
MNKDFLKKYPVYTGGPLADSQFLLKVRGDVGFMTKLNKDGSVPVAFKAWTNDDPIVFTEIPREGWKIVGIRSGKSQTWARVLHPEGFILEIYAYSNAPYRKDKKEGSMMGILENCTIEKGEIKEKLTWRDNMLHF